MQQILLSENPNPFINVHHFAHSYKRITYIGFVLALLGTLHYRSGPILGKRIYPVADQFTNSAT